MEKNTSHDPLDEYVRRSFDHYEEEPVADMWSRVEHDLEPAAPMWRMRLLPYRLRIASTVILLLCFGLVCEYVYYENKVQRLTRTALDNPPAPSAPPLPDVADSPAPRDTAQYRTPTTTPHARKYPNTVPAVASDDQPTTLPWPRMTTTLPKAGKPGAETPVTATGDPDMLLPMTAQGTPEVPADTLHTTKLADSFAPEAALDDLPVLVRSAVLVPLQTKQLPDISTVSTTASNDNKRSKGQWCIGLSALSYRTFEEVPPVQRPVLRPVFVSQQERPGIATDWWVRAGRRTGRWLGLESGIGFSESNRTTVHAARFRFADGTASAGSQQRRTFSYDLRTYGGSAAVDFRMEPADISTPIADQEPVVVRVWTNEHTQLLRLPVLLTGHFGSGRVQAVAKAGVVGNFFLKNDLVVTARVSQNNRLRFAQSMANGLVFERTENFFLGYWASAGAAFQLTSRWSVVVEPAVSGNFARRDARGNRLPDHFLAGVNIGINRAICP